MEDNGHSLEFYKIKFQLYGKATILPGVYDGLLIEYRNLEMSDRGCFSCNYGHVWCDEPVLEDGNMQTNMLGFLKGLFIHILEEEEITYEGMEELWSMKPKEQFARLKEKGY